VGIHLSNFTVVGVGNIEIAGRIEGQTRRICQRSAGGQSAVAAATAQAIAGDHGDDAIGRHLEHHGESAGGKVDVALAVKGDVVRAHQLGGGGELAAARK